MPDIPLESALLRITAQTATNQDQIEESISIRTALKTLLTTDKPIYQPGQTIHIRSLTLNQPELKPLADSPVTFEIEDAKGNKLGKITAQTDQYGIAHTDFVLANELNLGTWRIRVITDASQQEKTVNIERYVLPKYKINFTPDHPFYQPGQTIKGTIQADYFFGKPVANAKVKITCSKFDVAYEQFQIIEGRTSDSGQYMFEAQLPDHFVGQPLQDGKASVKIDVELIDTADHQETITRNLTITAEPIIIAAAAESGQLITGLTNYIYLVTTYADGTPAPCTLTWQNAPNAPIETKTDDGGFAQFAITPTDSTPEMQLFAQDERGQKAQKNIQLPTAPPNEQSLLLRLDHALYKVGDEIKLTALSTQQTGTLYLDIIKDSQTFLTRTLELRNGRAQDTVAIDATLSGTVQITAWLLGPEGIATRDHKIILIDPANDLNIQITGTDRTYLPGTSAELQFNVTDKNGKGLPAALGLIVVDEAVYALQENQPGLEKIYFYLEQEITKPRYEIHGYQLDDCVITPIPGPQPRPLQSHAQQAARILLASAEGLENFPLNVNTYQRNNKGQQLQNKLRDKLLPQYQAVMQALSELSEKNRPKRTYKNPVTIAQLVELGFLKQKDSLDLWQGQLKITGDWSEHRQNYHWFKLLSSGIDGKWATADDFEIDLAKRRVFDDRFARGGGMMEMEDNLAFGMAMPQAAGVLPNPAMRMFKNEALMVADESASAGAEPIRIREYFPETLYFEPALITDGQGRATLDLPLADSITTWRLTASASSTLGQLGSTTAGIRVFQDFFVDIDFPVALTQNDLVHVPVALYNYLKTDQQITLEVTPEEWFELKGPLTRNVTLSPDEVRAVYFPVTAKKVGLQKFTVTARGTAQSDALARSVEILPDGKENLITHSGRLTETVSHNITIPENAIADASAMFLKIYPGVLSQIVEGLDAMLRMPFGCFEQTSSVTYPNILVLDYLKSTGKVTPELQMKAEGFISQGYQRLVSFEVDGGGFEWFGKAPAHRILTAYGLMEFYDMARVHNVDSDIIRRTQQWLANAQENDGSYKPSEGGIREGAINKFTDDVIRNTAYITWALASTQYQGHQINKGLDYLRENLDKITDPYTIALSANTFAVAVPDDQSTEKLISRLLDLSKTKDDVTYWQSKSETPTHGTGASADIELTALAIQALVRAGRNTTTVNQAVNYLTKNKDAFGTWQSTQATIQALRAMLMAQRKTGRDINAEIQVLCNGVNASTIHIDNSNSDVMQMVDLKSHIKSDNNVKIKISEKAHLQYQLVTRFFLPRQGVTPEIQEPMSIKLNYDRTELKTSDILNVAATIRNNRPGTAKMVIVDLAIPPGFTLIEDQLRKLVENGTIEKYSTTARQIIVYLREIKHNQPVELSYQLLAKFPLKAQTPASAVYEYYNPKIRAETRPLQLTVAEPEK